MLPEKEFYMVDLQNYFNADCISYDENRSNGKFAILTCLPAEELPESNSVIQVGGIPFIFPAKEDDQNNNIECYNQLITFERGEYSTLYVLGASDNGSFYERLKIGSQIYLVGLSSWSTGEPRYKEIPALTCSHAHTAEFDIDLKTTIWLQKIELDPKEPTESILLPDNPCFHLIALTLRRRMKNNEK